MIGIFGGTFDPIHNGHLHVAQELMLKLPLDKIIFVPSAHPPHREPPTASAQDRFKMIELAIHDNPRFLVDDCELKRPGPSFTVDTLHYFKIQYLEEKLVLIMGADAYANFKTWHEWKEILTLCKIVVVNRPGNKIIATPHAQSITIKPCDISATAIRAGDLSEKTLPKLVLDYIQQHRIY